MAEEQSSYHDLSNLKELFDGLSDEENNVDSEDSANAGSSSAEQKANRRSKKRVKKAQKQRAEALKYTRPAFLNTIKQPNFGDTIETSINGDEVSPTGEYSSAMPSNVRNIRQMTANQTALNPGRNRFNLLNNDNNALANLNTPPSVIGGMAGTFDFLNSAGNAPGAQNLGRAKPVSGVGTNTTPSDNNTDLGKHLVQIWEHIRDTLDDIKDLLKEASSGHAGEKGGTAMPGVKSEENSGGGFLDGLMKALLPILALLAAGIAEKFGAAFQGILKSLSGVKDLFDKFGKDIKGTLDGIESHFGQFRKFINDLVFDLNQKFKNLNPKAPEVHPASMNPERAPHGARPHGGQTSRALPTTMRNVTPPGATARGSSRAGAATRRAARAAARAAAGAGIRVGGAVARPIGRAAGATGGVIGAVIDVREFGPHVMGAIHNNENHDTPGMIADSIRAASDLAVQGGPTDAIGSLGHFPGLNKIPLLGKPTSDFLKAVGRSKWGKPVNNLLRFGIRKAAGMLLGAGEGAAEGFVDGGPIGAVAGTVGGAAIGFLGSQAVGVEGYDAADYLQNRYDPNYKNKKIRHGKWKKTVETAGSIGHALGKMDDVDGYLMQHLKEPSDKPRDAMVKKYEQYLPKTAEDAAKAFTSKNPLDSLNAFDAVLHRLWDNYLKDAQANDKQIKAALDAERNQKTEKATNTNNHTQISFNFTNAQITSKDDAKKLVEQAVKSLRAQDQLSMRAQERFSNLGLPPQTNPLPMA